MAASTKENIELCLQSLTLLVSGGAKTLSESNHTVTIELVWPRNGIASKTYARVFTLNGNQCSFTESDWYDSVMCKESVDGRFALKVSVSQALTDSVIAKLIRVITKAAASTAADVVEDGVAAPLGKIAAAPVDYLATLIADYTGEPIAEAVVTLDAADFADGGKVLTLPLVCPTTLKKDTPSMGKAPAPRKTIIKNGDPNGTVVLSIKAV